MIYFVSNDQFLVFRAVGQANPSFCGMKIRFQVCGSEHTKACSPPSLPTLFFLSMMFAVMSLPKEWLLLLSSAWFCQFWARGLALPFPRSLWKPASQLALQSGVHTTKELAVDPPTDSAEEMPSLSQSAVESTFHFTAEEGCVIHKPFLTKILIGSQPPKGWGHFGVWTPVTSACQNDLTWRNATVNPVFYCGFKIWDSIKLQDILIMPIVAKCVSTNI